MGSGKLPTKGLEVAKAKDELTNEELIQARIAAANASEDEAPAELFPNAEVVLPAELLAEAQSNNASTLVLPDDGRDYSREMDESDVVFPRVRLTQGQSKAAQLEDDAVRLGNWHLSTGNVNLGRVLKVTFLDMFKSRSLWVNNLGRMCFSANFVLGQGQPGGSCLDCGLKDWKEPDVAGGKRIPPKCSVNYNYMALVQPQDPDVVASDEDLEYIQALMLFARSGAKVAKSFNSKRQQSKKYPWYYWTYTLDRVSTPGPNNSTYYAPIITSIEKTDAETKDRCVEFMAGYSDDEFSQTVRRTITVEDSGADDDDDD